MNSLQVNVKCPYCKRSFMAEDKMIDGYPSIKVTIQLGDKRGLLYLSSIYGSYSALSEISVPLEEIVLFFCPHCYSSLLTKYLCDKCQAPMTSFKLLHGGEAKICSRRGCKKHQIEFSSLDQEISEFYKVYSVFSAPFPKE